MSSALCQKSLTVTQQTDNSRLRIIQGNSTVTQKYTKDG